MVNLFQNPHKSHPIASQLGWGIDVFMTTNSVSCNVSLQCNMKYVILDPIRMAQEYISNAKDEYESEVKYAYDKQGFVKTKHYKLWLVKR